MDDGELAAALAETTEQVAAGEQARNRRLDLVRAARERNWSQQRIADAAGISQQAIAKILGKH